MSTAAALLVALLAMATGIERPVDPGLTAIAERRVLEVQADFSHAGAAPGATEVIAWNVGQVDPVAHVVEQWRGSPDHWSLLTDPAFDAIGCAVDVAGDRTYAVCVLAASTAVPTPQPEPEPAAADEPAVTMLPDAAMAAP